MGTKMKVALGILGLLIFGYLVISIISLQRGEANISASQAELIQPGLLPNLSLSVTDGVDAVKVGDKVTYEIRLQNRGLTEKNLRMIGFIASPTEISPLSPNLKTLLEECLAGPQTIALGKINCASFFNYPSLTEVFGNAASVIGSKRPSILYQFKEPSFTWQMDKLLASADLVKKIPVTIVQTQSPTIVTTIYVYQRWPNTRFSAILPWGGGNWRIVAISRDIDMVERTTTSP